MVHPTRDKFPFLCCSDSRHSGKQGTCSSSRKVVSQGSGFIKHCAHIYKHHYSKIETPHGNSMKRNQGALESFSLKKDDCVRQIDSICCLDVRAAQVFENRCAPSKSRGRVYRVIPSYRTWENSRNIWRKNETSLAIFVLDCLRCVAFRAHDLR